MGIDANDYKSRKMKIKRQKKVGRILSFFKNNYGHRPPFQVLIDGTFTQACLQMKVNIKDQLPKYLGEVKLLTTKCCIQECEKLGPSIFGATVILKQFGIHKCSHEEGTKPAMKCLKAMVGTANENRYFVATQDPELREKCRKVPGTPILYLHSSAPTLERPSEMIENQAQNTVEARMTGEQKRLENLKRQMGLFEENKIRKKKKKYGNKNPLSCLKSKKKSSKEPVNKVGETKTDSEGKQKTKRKRNRKKKTASENA